MTKTFTCPRCQLAVERPSPQSGYCRPCNAARRREWAKKNPEKEKKNRVTKITVSPGGLVLEKPLSRSMARNREIRKMVLLHYGNKCVCCGETADEFLTVDHVEGGGNKHRFKTRSTYFFRLIVREGFPSTYRLLCYNCNCSRGHRGYCPHERTRLVLAG